MRIVLCAVLIAAALVAAAGPGREAAASGCYAWGYPAQGGGGYSIWIDGGWGSCTAGYNEGSACAYYASPPGSGTYKLSGCTRDSEWNANWEYQSAAPAGYSTQWKIHYCVYQDAYGSSVCSWAGPVTVYVPN